METIKVQGVINGGGKALRFNPVLGCKSYCNMIFPMGTATTKQKIYNTVLFDGVPGKFVLISPEKPVKAWLADGGATAVCLKVTGPLVMQPVWAGDAFYLANDSTYASGNSVGILIAG